MTCPTLELAQQLIACASVTPEDGGCQQLIAQRLKPLGFQIESFVWNGVTNLWARHGTGSPLLVFAGHTDVVPPGDLSQWTSPPFTPTIRDGILYGRGAADMKSGVAAMVTACEVFVKKNPKHAGSVAILLTSDEEGDAVDGTEKVLAHLTLQGVKIDYAVVGEATSKDRLGDAIRIGRRGSLSGQLKVYGKQGHVAYPLLADNPIHKAISLLQKLVEIEWDKGNQHFQPTSFQMSNIHAGTGAGNVIPGELVVDFNLRFSPEITAQDIQQRFADLIEETKIKADVLWKRPSLSFYTQPGRLITAVQSAIRERLNIETVLSTAGGTSDGRYFAPLGVEVIEFGPVNASIHHINEHVRVEDLAVLSEIHRGIIEKLLV